VYLTILFYFLLPHRLNSVSSGTHYNWYVFSDLWTNASGSYAKHHHHPAVGVNMSMMRLLAEEVQQNVLGDVLLHVQQADSGRGQTSLSGILTAPGLCHTCLFENKRVLICSQVHRFTGSQIHKFVPLLCNAFNQKILRQSLFVVHLDIHSYPKGINHLDKTYIVIRK